MRPDTASGEHRKRPHVYFGWVVVAACFVMAVFAWGIGFYGPSIYLHRLHEMHGWPVRVISAAITCHFIWGAILVVWLADIQARLGLGPATALGLFASAAGAIAWASASEPWQMFPAAGLTGTGWAVTSGAAINAILTPWFDKQRGTALAHAYNGASAGGFLITPLWTWAIAEFGFQGAALLIAAASALIMVPLIGLVLSRSPGPSDFAPDGIEAAQRPAGQSAAVPSAPLTRRALLSRPSFVTLSAGFALAIFAQMGLISHLVTRLAPDLGERGAAWALTMATVAAILGRFAAVGLLGQARNRRLLAAANFLMQATGVVLLIVGSSPLPLLAGCLLFGLGIGNLLSLPPLILQSEVDPADVVRAVSLTTAVNQLVYAFGPGVLGVLRDASGSYTIPFLLAALIQVAAVGVVLAGQPVRAI